MRNITDTLKDIEIQRGQYTQLLQEITQIEQSIEDEEGELADAEEAINALVGNEVDLTGMDTEIATIQGQIEIKDQEIGAAAANVEALKEIEEKASELQAQLDGLKDEIKDVHASKQELDSRIKSNHEQISSLTKRLQKNSEENLAKQELWRAAVAKTARIELMEKLEKLDDLEGQMNELLEQGPIIDEVELKNMYELVSRYDRADAMLKALAEGVGVSVQIDGELKANWNIDGLDTEVGSETAFAQEMAIQGADFTLNLKKETKEDMDWVEEK